MDVERNALVLFTKAPTPGLTKTRLTEARGGILTPEEAAALYQASLLDVADIALRALEDCRREHEQANGHHPCTWDFVLSCPSEDDRSRLQRFLAETGLTSTSLHFLVDRGSTFDEHFNDAFRQLFAQGYHSVVMIGGDLPVLRPYHIQSAFQWLTYLEGANQGALVLAPCQDCGVSLVGVTANTPIDFTGVFYSQQGVSALDKIVDLCAAAGIPLAMLDQISDIDTAGDLAHAITLLHCLDYATHSQPNMILPRRMMAWIQRTGIVVSTPPNTNHDPRELVDAVY